MSLALLAPLLYLAIGLGLGRLPFDIKGRASALLTQWIIPAVIVYNIATHRPGVFAIMLGMMVMVGLMLLLSRAFTRDPVQNLCFAYLNIGWLGLPVASTLFGDEAARIIIAAYVGSSLVGNSVGVGLMVRGQHFGSRLRQTLQAPPVWALLLGLACMPLGAQIEHYAQPLYGGLKFLMSFLGMAILGIWLSATRLQWADFKKARLPFIARLLTVWALVSLFVFICRQYDLALVTQNMPALYLIGLLPPAANIIVLETHYMKSGRSASMIASGTCLSIVAIGVYAGAMLWLQHRL